MGSIFLKHSNVFHLLHVHPKLINLRLHLIYFVHSQTVTPELRQWL